MNGSQPPPAWRLAAIMLLLAALTSLWQLGALPVSRSQELRVAETAREMLASGDYLTPRLNGELRFQKPPLAYWLTAASYRLFGRVDEFSARLPAALAAMAVMLLVSGWTRRQFGAPTALASLAVLSSSYVTLRFFHSGETDPLLLLFVSIGAFAAWATVRDERPAAGSRMLLWVAITGGALAKGLPPALLPLFTATAWCLISRQPRRAPRLLWPPGVLLLLVAGGAWYLWLWRHHPEVTAATLGRELRDTYLRGDHPGPPWYYLPRVFLYFAPWSVLLPVVAWQHRRWPTDPALGYLLIWLLVTFVILSVNVNKQIQYALLLAPPLAILLGHALASGLLRQRCWQWAAYGGGTLLLTAAGYFSWHLGPRYAWPPLLAMGCVIWLTRTKQAGVLLLAVAMIGGYRLGEAAGLSRGQDRSQQLRAAGLAARGLTPLAAYGIHETALGFYAQAVPPHADDPAALLQRVHETGVLYVLAPGTTFTPAPSLRAEPLLQQPQVSLWRLAISPGPD